MKILLLIDIQNDFCPGGALAVARGDEVVPVANALIGSGLFDVVMATQDSHPAEHKSFAVNNPGRQLFEQIELCGLKQTMWPAHCVAGTEGAKFHPDLDVTRIRLIVPKGTNPKVDSYSGFFDNARLQKTELNEHLLDFAINRELRPGDIELTVLGLATDYCVKATSLDGKSLGYKVNVVVDGCRAVDLTPGDGERAFAEMQEAGVQLTTSEIILGRAPAQLRPISREVGIVI